MASIEKGNEKKHLLHTGAETKHAHRYERQFVFKLTEVRSMDPRSTPAHINKSAVVKVAEVGGAEFLVAEDALAAIVGTGVGGGGGDYRFLEHLLRFSGQGVKTGYLLTA